MTGRFLLDTNIIIAMFAQEASVLQNLADAEEVFLPSIVLGELYYGARKSIKVETNVRRVDELAGRSSFLVCDSETALHYGEVKHLLQVKGRPLPENDIWVAAIALQHGLTLVTRDAHFNEIVSLTVVAW